MEVGCLFIYTFQNIEIILFLALQKLAKLPKNKLAIFRDEV